MKTKNYASLTLFLILLIASISNAMAQTPQIYKSSGTGTNSTFLLGSTSYARKSQLLFTPGSLTGATSGTISRIYFRYGTTGIANGQTLTNFTVSMGQPAVTSFSPAGTGYSFFTGLTTVLSVPSYFIPAGTSGNWFSIDLTTAFPFDPAQSLIIELKFDSTTSANFGTLGGSNSPVRKINSSDVNATSGSGSSGTFQDFGFDLGSVTAVPQLLPFQTLEIYPSPATDLIRIRTADSFTGKAKIQLFNSLGQLVISKETSADAIAAGSSVNTQELPTGMYIVTLVTGNSLYQGVITIVH